MPKTTNDDKARKGLFDRLLEQRIILLSEPVTSESAERLVAQLLYLDALDPKKPIRFFLNTPGGSVSDGFAVFDTVRAIRAPVTTVCTGISASMGTVLMLAPKEKKRRVCLPNTRIMLHQPSAGYQGSASDIEIGAREILKLRDRLIEIYVAETGRDAEEIKRDINRDFWLSAEEAVEYGLVDRVVESVHDLP